MFFCPETSPANMNLIPNGFKLGHRDQDQYNIGNPSTINLRCVEQSDAAKSWKIQNRNLEEYA